MALKLSGRKNRAIVAVEFALVMLPLMIILFGILEYGWYFLCASEVTNAARHGARVGITADATAGRVQSEVTALMIQAGLNGSGYAVTMNPPNPATLRPGERFTVSISLSYPNVSLINIPLVPIPATLAATVTMAKEGP